MAKELKARFFASLRMTARNLALPMEVADGEELKARFFASLRMTARDLALPMEVADGEGTQGEILRFAQNDSEGSCSADGSG